MTGKPSTKSPEFTPQPPPPPLSILFDFSSDSNQMSIHGTKTETKLVNLKTCQEGFVYDPFVDKCREAFQGVIGNEKHSSNSNNSTYSNLIKLNCSGIRLNLSDTVLYSNGTLWVPCTQQITTARSISRTAPSYSYVPTLKVIIQKMK